MIPGTPVEARWHRPKPRLMLPVLLLQQMVAAVFPHQQILDVQPLADGFRNANFKLRLSSAPTFVVLRVYEHDASLCRKEADLLNLIKSSVATPEVIHAEAHGLNGSLPFAFTRYVEGITFHELKRSGDVAAISEAAFNIGQTLAHIGRIRFPTSGWLGPGPKVGPPLLEGPDPEARFVELCLESAGAQSRMDSDLRNKTRSLVWSYAPQLASLDDEICLVHGDFGKRNLLVQQVGGKWNVAAVLDWEFAISGSALTDVGHFLRYECASHPVLEPHFSEGYLRAGGKLPQGWRQLARIVDLIALCELLTHDELPHDAAAELVELVRATVESRDPQFK